ncbi:MAG: hypothetical protein ACR2NO_09775, partial [Chloroflexota bacterium]
ARELHREAVDIFRAAADLPLLATALGGAAAHLVATGRTQTGLRLGGGAEALEEEVGGRAPVALRPFEDPRRLAEAQLDQGSSARRWKEGRALSLDELLRTAAQEGVSSGSRSEQ